jgi:hypothetical protein
VANGVTGILASSTPDMASPEVARRAWPQWLALGAAMIAVAVTAVVWDAAGARLLLGAFGLFLAVRGILLLRGARSGAMSAAVADRARGLGSVAVAAGAAALGVAALSGAAAAGVLMVAVPVALLGGAASLMARRGPGRAVLGWAVLVWSVLVTGMLVAAAAAQGWDRAAEVATVVSALVLAVGAVPLVVAALGLRQVAAQPAPAPARPAACAGCACGAGGCGA